MTLDFYFFISCLASCNYEFLFIEFKVMSTNQFVQYQIKSKKISQKFTKKKNYFHRLKFIR